MHLRRTQRWREDGSTVGCRRLAHDWRVDAVKQAEVGLTPGRADELDVPGLRRPASSITRFTQGDGRFGAGG